MIPDFGRYEMYNNDAIRVRALTSAEFVRLHDEHEARDFVLDLYRYYQDDEMIISGVDIDWTQGEAFYKIHRWSGTINFELATEQEMLVAKAMRERAAAKLRYVQECINKWEAEHPKE